MSVSEGSPESLFVWHNGKTVLSDIPVNTGVPGAATATGTFAVFEHIPVTTMIGTNVDGSHYTDPGIQWVSYFNGGDALHYYPRAGYGYPQSNGCVEMDEPDAASVYRTRRSARSSRSTPEFSPSRAGVGRAGGELT